MRKLSLTAAVVMAMAFGAQPAIAQQLSMSILNSGKAPEAPVPVKVVEDGQETVVATTDSNGNAGVDMSAFPPGTEVCVIIVDGEVHLVPKAEGEDCDDDAIGIIPWGGTNNVNVDVGTGAFSTGQMAYGTSQNPWRIGVGADWAKFVNLEDTGCFDTQNCDPDDSGIGFKTYLEYDFHKNWHLGAEASYRNFTVNEDFGVSDVSEVDVDVLGLGLYGGYHTPVGNNRLSIDFGLLMLDNDADIRSFIGGQTFTENRSESGLRLRGGINYDVGLSDDWSMRLGAGYVAGDENDADTNVYGGVALSVSF